MANKKKVVWNKSQSKMMSSKYLKERKQPNINERAGNDSKQSAFKIKLVESIKNAARTQD